MSRTDDLRTQAALGTGVAVVEPLTGSVAPEHYMQRYWYTPVSGTDTSLALVEERLAQEPFQERRKLFERQARFLRAVQDLGADLIDLPGVQYLGDGVWETPATSVDVEMPRRMHGMRDTRAYTTVTQQFHLGGVRRRVQIGRRVVGQTVGQALYIGDMPARSMRAYERAIKLFPDNQVVVVSRDATLFDVRTETVNTPLIERLAEPLLIAATPFGRSRFLLLSAWGLEHELPRSLGGVLDDVAVVDQEQD